MSAPPPPTDREALDGAPYGIIDPDYARVFTMARCLAWQQGYALMMQGSFTRDLDLLAVPWTERASDPEHLVRRIIAATGLKSATDEPGEKPHGRLVWTLLFPEFGDPRFVDLGVMPSLAAAVSRAREAEARAERAEAALRKIADQDDACPRCGRSSNLDCHCDPEWCPWVPFDAQDIARQTLSPESQGAERVNSEGA